MAISLLKKGSVSSSSLTTIYTAATGVNATVSNFVLCNNSASAVNVDVYVSGTLATKCSLAAGVGQSKIVPEMIGGVSSGNTIRIQCSTSNGVNYIIYGEEVGA